VVNLLKLDDRRAGGIDMPSTSLKTLDVRNVAAWRAWLAKNHQSASEVWLVFQKRHTGRSSIAYEDAVDEALCFGWIDSLVRRLDDDRYARKFTPRRPDSRWSTVNRKRYARLAASGRLMPAGRKLAPTERSGDAPQASSDKVPTYIEQAIKRHRAAWNFFESLAPSHRRMYIMWIDSAKREETKARRLREAIQKLAAGEKLGLK
jgi:uncharacterized protein YdeI (YjbR/CyaY-like superfamily)